MARRVHQTELRESHTPDSRYATCSCSWEATETRYGASARMRARSDAIDHENAVQKIADAQHAHAEQQRLERAEQGVPV